MTRGPVTTGRGPRTDAFVERLLESLENPNPRVADVRAALAYCETLGLTEAELGDDLVFYVAFFTKKVAEADAAGRDVFHVIGDE